MLRDFERMHAIRSHWPTRTFGELLIDCEGGPDAPGRARRELRDMERR